MGLVCFRIKVSTLAADYASVYFIITEIWNQIYAEIYVYVDITVQNKSDNDNERLLKSINDRGKIHIVPAKLHGKFILRFAVCSRYTELQDINYAWKEIQEATSALFSQ